MKRINQFRRQSYTRLLMLADVFTELAFSRDNRVWQLFFVYVADGIDAIALRVAPPGMMDEMATVPE